MKERRNNFKAFLPGVIAALMIGYFSTSGAVKLPASGLSLDKFEHFAAYALLSWLFLWALRSNNLRSLASTIAVVAGCSVYGAALEVAQLAFFSHRYFEWWDMFANVCGALFSSLLFKITSIKKL